MKKGIVNIVGYAVGVAVVIGGIYGYCAVANLLLNVCGVC